MSDGHATTGASEASPSPIILITDYEQGTTRSHEPREMTEHALSSHRRGTTQDSEQDFEPSTWLDSDEARDVFEDLESRYSEVPVSPAEFFAPIEITAQIAPLPIKIVDDAPAVRSIDPGEMTQDSTVPQIVIVSPEEGEALLEAQKQLALKKAVPPTRSIDFLESIETRHRERRRSMSMLPERPPKTKPTVAQIASDEINPKPTPRPWGASETAPDGGWRMRTRESKPVSGQISVDIVVVYLYNSIKCDKSRDHDADLNVFRHYNNVDAAMQNATPATALQRARTDLGRQTHRESPSKQALSSSRKVSTDHHPQSVNWLQDHDMLRKHIPESRIITVGFDIMSTLSLIPNYETAAGQLLDHLQLQRGPGSTPIILLGHALASLIVIQTLALASLRGSRAANVLTHTAGAFLFSCSIASPLSRARRLADLYGAKSNDKLFSDLSGSPAMDRLSQLAKKGLFSTLRQDRTPSEGPPNKRHVQSNSPPVIFGFPITHFFTEDDEQRSNSQALSIFLGAPVRTVIVSKSFDSALKFTGHEDTDFLRLMLLLKSSLQTCQLLHAAVAGNVERLGMIVEAGANPNLRDRWGQTALQVAARMENEDVVHAIVRVEGVDIDVCDNKSNTPLHHAVRTGNETIVRTLLHHGADINRENSRKRTPRDLAEKHRSRMHIAKLLKSRLVEGPDQSLRAQRVGRGKRPTSKDGQMACKNYQITITEVFASYSSDKHWSVKISVDALLYGKNTLHDVLRHVRPKEVRGKSPICTWIHVPENNMIWIEDLFARLNLHSAIWRETQGFVTDSLRNRAITPHVGNTEFPSVFFPFLNYEANTRQENRNNYIQEVYEEYLRQEEVIADIPPEDMLPATNRLSRDFVGHKVLPLPDGMNLESYPYLEEDSDSDFSDHGAEGNDDDLQAEEKALIKSYLYGPPALHVRRTLDQFYYHMLSNTKDRDQDQVVSRWCQNVKHQSRHNLLMVDQLWLWKASQSHPSIAGQSETYVITCFPSRTGTGHGYQRSLDDLRHLVLDPSHRKRSPISKPEDLVSRVLESCCSVFDRMQNAEMLRFFQMFDDSIGSIDDQESRLFRDFQRGSTRLLELSPINKYYNEQKHTLLVDLLDIREEIKLLVEIKDIRDEVNIILTVLGIQWTLLERLSLHGSESPALTQGSVATNIVQTDIDDFTRMDSQARTIQEKLNTLMDLKQKAANAWEARESRETTVAASKQGNTVLVFTVVTIVFLPLSFMSSFFAIEIAAFPKDATTGETNWPLGIVTGLLFGISLSLSIPLIVFALNMESCSAMYRELRYNHLTRIGISIVGLLPFLASSDTPGSSRRRWTERLQKSHGAYADQPDRTGHTQGATYSTEIFGETKHAMSYRSTTSSHTLTENLTDRNHFSSHSAKNGSSKRRKYV